MTTSDRETRDRLLEAAALLFGSRGFKRVTIREICRDARANVAAVNYHFGDKLGLYREVLRMAVDTMRSTVEDAKAAGDRGDAEARLRAFIHLYVDRVVSSGADSWIHRLMSRELVDPTPALDVIVQDAIRPRMVYLRALVGELLGRSADDQVVMRGAHSIHALCISLIPNPITSRLYPELRMTPEAVKGFADHIVAFSLAGLRADELSRGPVKRRAAGRPASRPTGRGV